MFQIIIFLIAILLFIFYPKNRMIAYALAGFVVLSLVLPSLWTGLQNIVNGPPSGGVNTAAKAAKTSGATTYTAVQKAIKMSGASNTYEKFQKFQTV